MLVNPDAETESAYRKLQREFVDLKDQLAENRDQPAVTADGIRLELLANVNSLADAQAAVAMGASGRRPVSHRVPVPDAPRRARRGGAARGLSRRSSRPAPNRSVTIRTLDLGGDKTVPYLGHSREANPFMGWRRIRLSFEHPEFFLTQIRAILRAAATRGGGAERVRLMFPMITTLEEMRSVRGDGRNARKRVAGRGRHAATADVPIGMMLEVPAAAVSIDALLDEVDFVSIGSNDLVQYLMAADRDNPKVSHLCQPLSPAVLRVLSRRDPRLPPRATSR